MSILRAPLRRAAFPAPTIALACLLALLAAAPSGAQHLYLDANGDGINTSADVIAPSGATALDVWLRTDSNGDGLPAECPSADGPLTIAGYEFIVRASNGTVAWNSYVNLAPGYGVALGDASNATDFRTGYSGPMLAAGTYRLGTLTVTPSSGTPSLGFATASPLDPSYMTAFVSACSGNDLDNSLKLGLDWFDTAGAAYGGTANTAPAFQPASAIEMDEGTTRIEPLAATDG
ncbi:MAG TPA: hypothetical protein VFV33_12845, partial [Gemmatimonadaceae bacterium]|nr:hypothetical protein [Gemmatimonadaceae bacterium]